MTLPSAFDPAIIHTENYFETHILRCESNTLTSQNKTPITWLGKIIRWLLDWNSHMDRIQGAFAAYMNDALNHSNAEHAFAALVNLRNFEAKVIKKHNLKSYYWKYIEQHKKCSDRFLQDPNVTFFVQSTITRINNLNRPLKAVFADIKIALELQKELKNNSVLNASLSRFHSTVLNGFCIRLSEYIEQNVWHEEYDEEIVLLEEINQAFSNAGPLYSPLQISDKLQNIKQKLESANMSAEHLIAGFEKFTTPFWKPGQIEMLLSLTYLNSSNKEKLSQLYANWHIKKSLNDKPN